MAERTARNPRGAGRKPLDKNHKTIGVTIRFSEDIYNKIETKCNDLGLNISSYVRMLIYQDLKNN